MVGIFQVLLLMLLTAHYLGCLFYAVGKWSVEDGKYSWLDEEDITPGITPVWPAYTSAFYWSVVTLFTTGINKYIFGLSTVILNLSLSHVYRLW